jgi:quinoprotein glucose dehydrogenase
VQALKYSQPAMLKARKHPSLAVRRAAMLVARSIASGNVTAFIDDPKLQYEVARAINDVPIPSGYSKLGEKLTANCPPEIVSRAINVNFRMGGAEPAKRLAAYAASPGAPMQFRVTALEDLANWEQPDEIDRVMGLWRPIQLDPTRRAEAVAVAALKDRWPMLWKENDPALLKAAMNCVVELEPPGQTTNIIAIFRDPNRPVDVRAKALESLGGLNDTNFGPAMDIALKDDALRIGALALVQTNTAAPVVSKVVAMISERNDVRTMQAALSAIRRIAPPEAAEPLKADLEKLGRKELPTEIGLDLLQAADSYPSLKEAAEAAAKSAFTNVTTGPLLIGGDAKEGKRLFTERNDLACTRCHTVGGEGGKVGPALDGIGARQSREYLLESIQFPNKVIAKGFESLLVTLNDNTQVAGLVTRETGAQIELNSPEDGPVVVRKNDIRNISRSLSAMPEGLDQMMTPFELRNLVEYLASLK